MQKKKKGSSEFGLRTLIGTRDAAQSTGLPRVHKALGSILIPYRLYVMAHSCNLSVQKLQAGHEFKASKNYSRPCPN